MDIQTLERFLYIAKAKSFTKAAEHFYIGQPTLSRQIVALENELGVKLFERGSRSTELTAAGKVFADESERLIDQWSHLLDSAQRADKGELGSLRIASIGAPVPKLNKIIATFRKAYPDVKISIEHQFIHEVGLYMENDCADIGITLLTPETNTAGFSYIPLSREPFALVVPSAHPLMSKDKIVCSDLDGVQWIFPFFASSSFLPDLFAKIGHTSMPKTAPKVSFTASIESTLLQVGAGLGISIMPEFAIGGRERRSGIVALNISNFHMAEEVILYWKNSNQNPALKNFVRLANNWEN